MNPVISGEQLKLFNPHLLKSFCQNRFTFIDLFAGIGGFRIALEKLGGKCLGYSEIDRDAREVYQKNFINYVNSDEIDLGDVKQIHHLPWRIDLIVGGVPCQPWSIAGKSGGFDDPRGRLWFDVIRIVELNQPQGFIFENVKGLTDPRHQKSFSYILESLTNSGYQVQWKVLNSYDFGLPQDRQRVFIVGNKTLDNDRIFFDFPQPLKQKPKLYNAINHISCQEVIKTKFPPEILYGGKNKIPPARGRFQKIDELNDFFIFADIRGGHTTIHSWDLIRTSEREKYICEVLRKNRRSKKYGNKDGNPLSFADLLTLIPDLKLRELEKLVKKNIIHYKERGYEFVNSKISSGINGISKIFMPYADAISTLTATGTKVFVSKIAIPCQTPDEYKRLFIKEVYRKRRFKSLTVKDYAQLQGFPDYFIPHPEERTAKKQFGNAVSVPVVFHLTQSLLLVILQNETNQSRDISSN
ncbi:DNA (cytosine-5-)-methyltransferase [Dactylococcopsis salina]|uniref:Cytosine-specific methyltransferase n=2 Tax=Dactylococcopsis salina TaxID=292566 RepID=K9YT19_DACS8|nr:DNA-methyltransferase Dcm [Dactylococcopsis salina PCC 8305]